MVDRFNIPSVTGNDIASLVRWARDASGKINEFMRQRNSGAFYVWNKGCETIPVNTDINGAVEIVFDSPFVGNGTLIVTGVGFEGDVNVALNGTNLGTLSDADTSSEILYEVQVTNLGNGLNSFKIWSTSFDTGSLRSLEAWRNFTRSEVTTVEWGAVTGAGKPEDGATKNRTWKSINDTDSPVTAQPWDGFITNSSAGAITVNLPASPVINDEVAFADGEEAWGTNNVTIGYNGNKIEGINENLQLNTVAASGKGLVVTLVFTGASKGWVLG